MWHYDPPLRSMRFVLQDVLNAPASWAACPALAEVDGELAMQLLEQAGRFAAEVLAPINSPGDLEGCRWQDGEVRTPRGYREAYQAYVEGGWPALACDPDWGGQGLPMGLNLALYEMLNASCHAWMMYPGLSHGAYECLRAHGSPELRERYLRQIVSGEWMASMAMTEPHAGSDLGLLRTRAVPQDDGSLRVTGQKIFISGGEHDLTDNIVHLVLCRLPDAPAGSKGLSLALVPKILPDGQRNGVFCDGIEKKMGIKGSATCAMRFEQATGWLIGQPHRGLAAMFLMMNAARMLVATQGLGHLEIASQNARRYALERRQMRAPTPPQGAVATERGAADPIAWHPAMRRVLLGLDARVQAMRILTTRAGVLIDEAHHHPEAATRQASDAQAALLTPVLKAMLTEQGFLGAAAAQQVWGGHGYVHDYGIEQSVRDSRIAMVYEGTNEIQGIDLIQRKVLGDRGVQLSALLVSLRADIASAASVEGMADFAAALTQQCDRLEEVARDLPARAVADASWPLCVADDFLRALGHVLLAWAWLRAAQAALVALQVDTEDAWLREQLDLARHGVNWILPEALPYWHRLQATDLPLGEVREG